MPYSTNISELMNSNTDNTSANNTDNIVSNMSMERSPRSKAVSLPSIRDLTAPITNGTSPSSESPSVYVPFNYPNANTESKRNSISSDGHPNVKLESRRSLGELSSDILSRSLSGAATESPSNVLPPLHAMVNAPISPLISTTASSPSSLHSESSILKRGSLSSMSSMSSLTRLPSLTSDNKMFQQQTQNSILSGNDYFSQNTQTRPRLGSLPDFLSGQFATERKSSISKEVLRKSSNENINDINRHGGHGKSQTVFDPVLGKRRVHMEALSAASTSSSNTSIHNSPSPNASVTTLTAQRNGSITPNGTSPRSNAETPLPSTRNYDSGSPYSNEKSSKSDSDSEKKTRVVRRRTRTGCLTCRKRRIKCDERKPFCHNCEKSRKVCAGYEQVPYGARRYRHMSQPQGQYPVMIPMPDQVPQSFTSPLPGTSQNHIHQQHHQNGGQYSMQQNIQIISAPPNSGIYPDQNESVHMLVQSPHGYAPQPQQSGGVYILGQGPADSQMQHRTSSSPQPPPPPGQGQLHYQSQMVGPSQPYIIGNQAQQVIGVYYTAAPMQQQGPFHFSPGMDPHQPIHLQHHLQLQQGPSRSI